MSIDIRTTPPRRRTAPAPRVRPEYRHRMRLADTLQVLCTVSPSPSSSPCSWLMAALRAFGHDSAMALHQSFGKPALSLILAHAGLVIVGYALAYRQVTVFARDIVTADVLAVLRDGSLLATPGLRAASA
ncbi:hypothetical protein E3O53_08555 [Cryobacterium sp. TMT2-18-3]|uniref:hypothetical protein n=1 Tax=unclassified Cryobacterium TaxID=2649013 RepID=UPI00106C2312|nr:MULTISPECIES: hypothetical protein [unclassified Cryobacterium]TFC26313.1 hypothetical protein E3O22_11745 [Cryobacterium sp. TMT2-18-2]TFC35367.1 hypothetical protein E3O18_09580 [Cryobacterium sp. TMT2-42-4]TFC64508.1 hypothetical protein E3O53_08555 [Cryobacterium sp. TMT2-18-3]